MSYLTNLFSSPYVYSALSFLLAFIIAIRVFPVIIYTVRTKNIMDEPGGRKIHSMNIPTLGGVGLFASFSIPLILFGLSTGLVRPDLIKLLSIIGSTLILLFLGIKDDLIAIPPRKKLAAQIIAAGIVVFSTDLRVDSFFTLFGIQNLPYFASLLITFFVFILVINAFNLIDGIDGLAGSVAVMGCCTFGIFFLQNGQTLMALVSFTLIGATLGFLMFNLSKSLNKKLFMGDSGSMFVGFLLAYQGISFLSVNSNEEITTTIANAPIMLLAILSFPLVDTLRVFIIRAKQKRSPFSPDKNHIHHRLLTLGLSHRQSTSVIMMLNWAVIGVVFATDSLNINVQLVVFILTSLTMYLFPFTKSGASLISKLSNPSRVKEKTLAHSKYNNSKIVLNKPVVAEDNSKSIYFYDKKNNDEISNTSNQNKDDSEIKKILQKRMEAFKKASYIK